MTRSLHARSVHAHIASRNSASRAMMAAVPVSGASTAASGGGLGTALATPGGGGDCAPLHAATTTITSAAFIAAACPIGRRRTGGLARVSALRPCAGNVGGLHTLPVMAVAEAG